MCNSINFQEKICKISVYFLLNNLYYILILQPDLKIMIYSLISFKENKNHDVFNW